MPECRAKKNPKHRWVWSKPETNKQKRTVIKGRCFYSSRLSISHTILDSLRAFRQKKEKWCNLGPHAYATCLQVATLFHERRTLHLQGTQCLIRQKAWTHPSIYKPLTSFQLHRQPLIASPVRGSHCSVLSASAVLLGTETVSFIRSSVYRSNSSESGPGKSRAILLGGSTCCCGCSIATTRSRTVRKAAARVPWPARVCSIPRTPRGSHGPPHRAIRGSFLRNLGRLRLSVASDLDWSATFFQGPASKCRGVGVGGAAKSPQH